MNKKIPSLLMAATMAVTAVTPAFAAEVHVTEAGGTGNSKVTFEVVNSGSPEDPTIFSAYVPSLLPIKMDLEGNITVPTNAVIRNGVSDKAIQVEAAVVTTTGDWQHTDMSTAASGSPDSHLLGLELNGQDLTNASFPWRIDAAGSLDLNMQAVIPQQTAVTSESEIATIGFTLNWAKNKEELNATNELDKAKMDAALKNLTGKLTFTTSAYTGDSGIDISKNGDGSVIAVVNGQDATVYSEGGVLGIDTVSGVGMFREYKVSAMDLHGLDMSKMTDAAAMFCKCISLISLDLSDINMNNVKSINSMFFGCINLITLDMSNANMSNVIDNGSMFFNCIALTSINLSKANMRQATNMHSMFETCSSLTTANLSGADMSQVQVACFMFKDCRHLTTLDLSGVNINQLMNADGMFQNCISLSTLNLSDTNINGINNTRDMFSDCLSLTTLDLSGVDMSQVTETSNMFRNCSVLKTCYAKTQQDCDKLNSSSYKPANVNFVVKPSAA